MTRTLRTIRWRNRLVPGGREVQRVARADAAGGADGLVRGSACPVADEAVRAPSLAPLIIKKRDGLAPLATNRLSLWLCRLLAATALGAIAAEKAGTVTSQSQGLHGYIGFGHEQPPAGSDYHAGMGFYAAVWPLVDRPLANFQIGLPSAWITPDNSDKIGRASCRERV